MFIRKENVREYLRKYPFTVILLVLNFLVMLYASFVLGAWNTHRVVYDVGGISNYYLKQGEFWRIVTYAFFHDGIYHFLFNMFAIAVFSPPMEEMIGKVQFIIFAISSILLTPLPMLLVTSDTGVGASGLIFALFGFYFTLIVNRKIQIEPFDRKLIFQFIIFAWIFTFIFSSITWQLVSIFGHLGGWVTGVLFGFVFSKYASRAYQQAMLESANKKSL